VRPKGSLPTHSTHPNYRQTDRQTEGQTERHIAFLAFTRGGCITRGGTVLFIHSHLLLQHTDSLKTHKHKNTQKLKPRAYKMQKS